MDFKDESNIIEYLKFRKQVWKKYHHHLSELLKSNYKKAVLLTYWLNDYLKYICREKTFKPSQNINYEKGQIVKVHFGYRIGNEIGGPHYAVVLDVKSYTDNGTTTVVPFKSKRVKTSRYSRIYHLDLGNAFKNTIYEEVSKTKTVTTQKLVKLINKIKETSGEDYAGNKEIEAAIKELKTRQAFENEILKFSETISDSSVADLGQITTVSKIRIIHPTKNKHVLTNIKLPKDIMKKINDRIHYLYLSDTND